MSREPVDCTAKVAEARKEGNQAIERQQKDVDTQQRDVAAERRDVNDAVANKNYEVAIAKADGDDKVRYSGTRGAIRQPAVHLQGLGQTPSTRPIRPTRLEALRRFRAPSPSGGARSAGGSQISTRTPPKGARTGSPSRHPAVTNARLNAPRRFSTRRVRE